MIKEKFFNRENYLSLLKKRVSDLKLGYRQNLAFLGDELVGKTALIHNFIENYSDNYTLLIYLEIRPEPLASFAKRFISVLLYNFLANSGIALQEDLDFLIRKSEKFIPKTCERIRLILSLAQKRKKENLFTQLLSLCDLIHEETGKFSVLIFDEFHNLEKLGAKNIYKDWSKLLILHKSTMYILISSLKYRAKVILSKHLSLLFGNFEQVGVAPFDANESEKYIGHKLGQTGLDKGLKNFIIDFTGGIPMYQRIISEAIVNSQTKNLAEILENLIFDSLGVLNQRFSNTVKRFLDLPHSNEYITALYLVSSGRNRIKDIAHIMRMQKKEAMARVNFLLELDILTRSGDFLKINDRVFSFWLRFVYQEKLNSLTLDAKFQVYKFHDKIEEMIQEFLDISSRPLAERMNELLRLFDNDVMQVEKKKVRLNHFREIKALELRGRKIKEAILCRSSDYLWIIAIKPDFLSEEDITDFVKECKKFRQKPQRRIVITLSDIDANTKLRAMEEKVWTWDINRINNLFDLFYKPRVIV